ncbi:dihydrolipoamide acetyltransferase family protein [Buchananella felis]|uniref:dihydrolipoamide acetyltransferase family protein n=1 Tax=Buchananella felis TaxID=3231492 RepID=UPI00352956A7
MQIFKLPDVGEGLQEADLVTWLVSEGDLIEIDQPLCEIETAKSLVELPSPFAGRVAALLAAPGETILVGTEIVRIESGAAASSPPVSPAVLADDASPASPCERPATEAAAAGAGLPACDSAQLSAAKAAAAQGGEIREQGGGASSSQAPQQGSGSVLVGYGTSATQARRRARRPVSGERVAAGPGVDVTEELPSRPLAAPPVRRLARDLGIDLAEVPASSADGVVRRADVLAYASEHDVKQAALASAAAASSPAAGELSELAQRDAIYGAAAIGAPGSAATPGLSLAHDVKVDGGLDASWLTGGVTAPDGRSTRVPASSVRRATAAAMVESAFTAPHVTVMHTVDVTRTMELVAKLKQDREFAGIKVTPLLVVMKALLIAIRRHPEINATWDDQSREIVYHHHVGLGIAASTPRGLIVPNIKDAERKSLAQLGRELMALTAAAREGKTPLADLRGGTVTVTNFGVFGIDTGTPILNPGEAAILGLGAITQRPWVVDGELAVRWVTQLALSFDHRLVDGELGSRVLADVARVMEDPARALVWG